jgi:hypothetical protein
LKLPDASGNYEADCKTGQRYALKLLERIDDMAGSGAVLSTIAKVEPNGVDAGFWSMIEVAAKAGRSRAQEVADHWARMLRERKAAEAQGSH